MFRAHFALAAATSAITAVAGCTAGTYANGHFVDPVVDYAVGSPGQGWTEVDVADTNVAWFNAQLGAGMLVNSHCEGVQDAPLVALTNDLLIGTTERVIEDQALMPWSGREAMETFATAKLDGVIRKRAMFVLKKDGCVYDVVYDAPPDRFDAGRSAYLQVRNGLDPGPRRDRG